MFKIIACLNGIALILIILFTSIEIPAYDLNFYKRQYAKLNTAQYMGISEDHLMLVTAHLIDYMRGSNDDLTVFVNIHGVNREFFNQREKDHMVDVKDLFILGTNIRNLLIIVFLATIVLLAYKKELHILPITYLFVFLAFLAIVGGLGILIATDFNKYFTIFHEIFFSNDLWILDPRTDLLINLVPLQFFINISLYILFVLIGFIVLIIASCLFLKRPKPPSA